MEGDKSTRKNANPRALANPLSAITFWWMLPIFYTGYKRDLEIADLFETLKEHRSNKMGDRLENAWNREKIRAAKAKREPSLLRVILGEFGLLLVGFGCISAFLDLGVKMLQPIALGKLVLYYSTDPEERNDTEAYIYAGIIILCSFISVIVFHSYTMGTFHLALKINVGCCSLMYRKALRLSKAAMGETTVGQIVNLMSNDVGRMNGACNFVHNLWIGPIATIIVTVIMYQEIGFGAVIGIMYILCYIPLEGWLAKRRLVLRLQTALRTDERLRLMNEIINGMQVIKMYTWEKPFAWLVAKARRKEIAPIRDTSYIRGVNLAFILFKTRTAIYISILSYVLLGNQISASKVFVVTSCFNVLKNTMVDSFPNALAKLAVAYVSVKRMEKFLMHDETKLCLEYDNHNIKQSNGFLDNNIFRKEEITKTNGIVMKHVTAKWNSESTDNTLSDINLEVVPGRLVAVIGPVGAGKSSLFQAILKELPLNEGSIEMNGIVSYASQEPWLFSGSVRQNILFGEPMDKLRYQKVINCCALKTDFSLLPYGDKTIVGERGVSLSGGQKARINLARAVYKSADIYLLDDPLSAVDTHVGKELFDICINGFLKDKIVILLTHQLQYLKEVEQIIILNNGVKEAEGTYNQLKETGIDFVKLLEDQPSEDEEFGEHKLSVTKRKSLVKSITSLKESKQAEPEQVKEHRSVGKISGTVYKAYLNAAGNKCTIVIVVLFFVLSQVFASASDYFVSYWVNLEEYRSTNNITNAANDTDFWDFSRESCIYVYSSLILLTILITIIRSLMFFNVCMKASTKLHDKMFTSISRATMRFFNTNTSGRILNRFSKDMGNIDDVLPVALIDVLQIGLILVGIIVMIAIVNPWLLIPTVALLIIFNWFRIVYISTSRSIKRLEGITNSPVYGHLAASLQGLTTIRALKAQPVLQKEFDNHQDLHSTAWYLYFAASRTFAWWLDLACVFYIALVTISFFLFGTEQHGGNVGLAITQVMSMMGMLQFGIRQFSELENQMTSVERVNEYSQIEHERSLDSKPDKVPSADWPKAGRIEFRNIYLKYIPTEPLILKNVSFIIKPKEKVGIVGRTGAGKSSLIAALFQLTETEGSIIIDGLDTKDLGLHELRSKISIIPQEPVLFSGTMRKNLDPFDEYSDELIWRALEEVELIQAVSDLTGGLNSKMSEGGTNFSVGQKQLVCLARAIVRSNKILVLDEATANVDPQTDTLIQTTIRNKFAECTVLTIAHRLHTVMDSDKVLVMDAGTMVEFDHPHLLLKNQDGVLYKMVERTGTAMAETLKSVAHESYVNRSQK